jgi:hypothetical protein
MLDLGFLRLGVKVESKGAERDIKNFQETIEDVGPQASKMGETVKNGFKKVEQGAKTLADKVSGLSGKLKAMAAAAVVAVEATEDFRDGMSKLKTTADSVGVSVDHAKSAFDAFYNVVGDNDSAFEATNNLLNMKLQGEGLAHAVDLISGAVIRFPDTLNIESLADSLQETVATGEATGQFAELLGRLGMDTEQFAESLAMYADESDRLDIALSALSVNGLADVTDAWKKENEAIMQSREAKRKMQESLSALSEDLIPVITKVSELARACIDWFTGMSKEGQTAALVLGGIVIAIGPVSKAISGLSTVLQVVNGWLSGTGISAGGLGMVLGGLAIAIYQIASAWDGMTGWQKVVSIFGTISAAALGAALAFGVFHSAVSKGLAIAGIIAGIALVTAAVTSAQKKVESMARSTSGFGNGAGGFGGGPSSSSAPPSYSSNLSALFNPDASAVGTAYGYETETYTKGPTTYTSERYVGDQAATNVNINFTGSLAQVARVLGPEITVESNRAGSSARR